MGLSQYLTRRTWVRHLAGSDSNFEITITRNGQPYDGINLALLDTLEEEAATWRRATAIHAWFVEHAQYGEDDGRSYEVLPHQLQELLLVCRGLLHLREHDPARAASAARALLPSCGMSDPEQDEDFWEGFWEQVVDTETQLSPFFRQLVPESAEAGAVVTRALNEAAVSVPLNVAAAWNVIAEAVSVDMQPDAVVFWRYDSCW